MHHGRQCSSLHHRHPLVSRRDRTDCTLFTHYLHRVKWTPAVRKQKQAHNITLLKMQSFWRWCLCDCLEARWETSSAAWRKTVRRLSLLQVTVSGVHEFQFKALQLVFCFYMTYLKVFEILWGVSSSASEKYVFRHPTVPAAQDIPSLTPFNDNLWSDSQLSVDRCVLCWQFNCPLTWTTFDFFSSQSSVLLQDKSLRRKYSSFAAFRDDEANTSVCCISWPNIFWRCLQSWTSFVSRCVTCLFYYCLLP